MTDFRPIFARLGLQPYIDTFATEGFETWETILDVTESDLDALRVKLGHRRVLQREIAFVKGVKLEQLTSLNSPSHPASPFDPQRAVHEDLGEGQVSEYEAARRSKRRYRRHPKPDGNAPNRPPSAYVVFSNRIREELKHKQFSFTEIAKKVGENWQALSCEQKGQYEARAASAKEKYHQEMMSYKTTDGYREYQRYLNDFKIKHGSNTEEGRPRLDNELSATSSGSPGSGADGLNAAAVDAETRRQSDRTTSSVYSSASDGRQASGRPPSYSTVSPAIASSHPVPPLPLPFGKGSPSASGALSVDSLSVRGASSQESVPMVVGHGSTSPSHNISSTTSFDPNNGHLRRSPLKSVEQLPSFRHQDSSKSSITSGQSIDSTPATSLSAFRASEEESRHPIVLPPIASMTPSPSGSHAYKEGGTRTLPGPSYPSNAQSYTSDSALRRDSDHSPDLFEGRTTLQQPSRHALYPQPLDVAQSSPSERGTEISRPLDPLSVLADVAHAGRAISSSSH